jgi:2-polyprenyl-6-methoxyphenol hydroxylase-like FAD-dependent oxidoreductase
LLPRFSAEGPLLPHHAPAPPRPCRFGVGIDTARYGYHAIVLRDDLQPAADLEFSESDAEQVSAVLVLTSVLISPWQTTSVMLLGDAIHTMTPLQGLGGSTALRDAGLLCRKLVEVDRGNSPLLPGIHEYETAMIKYGFDAVRVSRRFADLVVSENWLLRGHSKPPCESPTWFPR